MSDTQALEGNAVQTDQAEREASGAHPYGRYLEEFEVGAVYKHWPAKTVTEADDHLFCLLTMNHHPLHINDVYASQSQQGRNVVAGPYVYSLIFGMTVNAGTNATDYSARFNNQAGTAQVLIQGDGSSYVLQPSAVRAGCLALRW